MRFRCLVAALAALVVLPSTALASDGTYTQILCANPDTGKGVIGENGKLPDGASNPHNVQWAGVSAALSICSGTISGSGGVPVTTGGGWSSSEANKGSALRYRAPAEIGFNGGVLYRYATMSGRFGWTINRSGRWDHIFGTPADERCTWGDGCSSRGTSSAPWSDANRVRIGSGSAEVNGFDASVLCDIPNGWQCNADGSQTLRIYGGKVTLEDRSAPSPGSASGALVSASTLSGVADVDFTASDAGAGLYRVRLFVDGTPRLAQRVHENGGRCADANPGNGDDYEFAYIQPCRSSASVSAAFDTRSLPDGDVALKVVVEDAGGNVATIVNRRVRIDNVPPPSPVSPPAVEGVARRGSGLVVVEGSWSDHGVAASIGHQWQRCRYDGSACVDVPGAVGATFVLSSADVGRRIRVVETASNREGSAQAASGLTALVAREDGTYPPDGDGIDNDGDGDTDEPGETVPPPPGGGSGGGAGGGSGGRTDNPSSAGATRVPSGSSSPDPSAVSGVNGEGASPRAKLVVAFAGRGAAGSRTVAFGRTLTATGRLVDEHDRPIRNAIVDVSSVAAVRGAVAAPAQPAVTGADGSFTYRVEGRASSRTLRFAYRFQRAGSVVADAALVLRVRAAVRLAVKLRGVRVGYSGKVLSGSTPRGGKLVVLQGRVRGGRWQTFATRRARRSGAFRGAYRLKVRRPGVRLQFRARAVAEAGWPYLEGTSRVVTRRVK